jgi:DNA-binding MarR family transcriptional regulator
MTGSDSPQHQDQEAISECALAWQTLRMAHDRVAQRLGAELSASCGLAINEFDVLLFLRSHAHEQVRIGALLEAVPLSQPALSRLVARLEARGLLARREAEGDARAVVVRLTDTGTALIERALDIHAQVVHETLVAKLPETERTALLWTLSQIGQ